MFFILSKILYFLLVPFWWIVILIIWSYFSKSIRLKKVLSGFIIGIIVLFSNPFFYHKMVSLWQPAPVSLSGKQTYEAGILLGGMSEYDNQQRGYFGNNADRFIQAANLYHQGIIKKIIVTGGIGSLAQQGPSEAVFLRRQLIANGVSDTAIIIETRSKNTYENAVFTKQIIDSMHVKPPFVLITSALHMKRSISVFNKTNFRYIAFPCDYKVIPQNFQIDDYLIPKFSLLNDWSFFIKEIVGLFVYRLTGKA